MEAFRDGVGETVFHLPISLLLYKPGSHLVLLRLPVCVCTCMGMYMQICACIGLCAFICTHECMRVSVYKGVCVHMSFFPCEILVDARGSKMPSGFALQFTAILLSGLTSWASALHFLHTSAL